MNVQNLGEISVGYKYTSTFEDRPKINSNLEAFKVLSQVIDQNRIGLQEQFAILYLNNANVVIGSYNGFSGGVTSTIVDVRIVVATALNLLATAVIICHNHPSANLQHSQADLAITAKLKAALKLMDINLLDHLIVTPDGKYRSLSEDGLL